MDRRCYACKSEAPRGLKCGGCRGVYYCDVSCQRKDWPAHKSVCRYVKEGKLGRDGKSTINAFLDELKGTALHTQLSALKHYAIRNGLGKGQNAFVADECTGDFGLGVRHTLSLKEGEKVYHLYTEWITSPAFPREYTADKLNIAVGGDRGGGAPSISLFDEHATMPYLMAHLLAITLLGKREVIETFFSTKVTIPDPWVLMVPKRGKLYLLRMTLAGEISIAPCGSIPLPGSLI
jgi:hypothetical protein